MHVITDTYEAARGNTEVSLRPVNVSADNSVD
jgi:hypothetical protein